MKFSHFSLILLTVPSLAVAMSFKAEMQPLKLPLVVSTAQPPTVKYTAPGEMEVGLHRMCGDADVHHFSQTHTEYDFVPHDTTEMKVMIGYWVTTGNDPLPTASNWYPVAYQTHPIAPNNNAVVYEGKYIPLNYSNPGSINGLNLIGTELVTINRIAERAFKTQANYKVFAGAFTCLDPQDSSYLIEPSNPNFKYSPSPVEITHALSHEEGLAKVAKDAVNGNPFTAPTGVTIKISTNPSTDSIYSAGDFEASSQKPYQFTIGNTGDVSLSGKLFDVFSELKNLTYPDVNAKVNPGTPQERNPTDAEKLERYRNDSNITNLRNKLAGFNQGELSYCEKFDAKVSSNVKSYKWEIFPLNLTCKYLFDGGAIASSYGPLLDPTTLPNNGDFERLKKDLARPFYIASVFETVQKKMHDDSSIQIARPNCFHGSPMITKLIASYPFKFTYKDEKYSLSTEVSSGGNLLVLKHYHPEPLFALDDWVVYQNEERKGIWGQVLTSGYYQQLETNEWAIKLPVGDPTFNKHKINKDTFNGTSLQMILRIRTVGEVAGCPVFC